MGRVNQEAKRIRKQYGIPRIMKVVRDHCLYCCCESTKEVKLCPVSHCPLWAYRMGRNPRPEDVKVARRNSKGDVTGYGEWAGYRN